MARATLACWVLGVLATACSGRATPGVGSGVGGAAGRGTGGGGAGGSGGAAGSPDGGAAGIDGSNGEPDAGSDASSAGDAGEARDREADGGVEVADGGTRGPNDMCPLAEAPVLLGVRSYADTGYSELRRIDPTTAEDSSYPNPLAAKPLGTLNGFYGDGMAVDKAAHRLYVVGSSSENPGYEGRPPPERIFTVDTSSGDVLSQPPLPEDLLLTSMTVDRSGILLGLFSDGGNLILRAIDPSTGATRPPYDTVAGLEYVGGHAVDPVLRRWYIFGGVTSRSETDHQPIRLFTIDMDSHAVLANPTVRWPGLDGRTLAVDHDGQLLGIYAYGTAQELRSIDPATGVDSPFPDPHTANVVENLETITRTAVADTDAKRMYLPGYRTNDITPRLFEIDLTGKTPARSKVTGGDFVWIFFACR